jgi:hypothetical protein
MSRLMKVKLEFDGATFLCATDTHADASGQWERRLESVGPIKRTATVDRELTVSPVEIKIDDADRVMQNHLKVYPKQWRRPVTLYVYTREGTALAATWSLTLQDWRREEGHYIFSCLQNLGGKLDSVISGWDLAINIADFPDAAPRGISQPVPFPAGVCASPHGKVQCWKVANQAAGVNRKYLLTWSDPAGAARITTIDKVVAGGKVIPAAKYSLSRDANGWEYCELNNKVSWIRVNVTARGDTAYTGANPVVALRGVLTGESITLVDDGHLDGDTDPVTFEAYCTANDWAMAGPMPGQVTLRDYIVTWCKSFNCFWHIDAAGQVHIKHFDFSLALKGSYYAQFANFVMVESQFDSFAESMVMTNFANRLRARFNFNGDRWTSEVLHDTTTGDYTVASYGAKEKVDEYILAAMDPAHVDYEARIKWWACGDQRVKANVALETWEANSGSILSRVWITHSEQVSTGQYYLVLDESVDYEREEVGLDLFVIRVTAA